uniref:Putative secreted protein n=1 Tax=Panstrongylus lignarius TaxID=156445 RepID=A0A224XP87_9HEMI
MKHFLILLSALVLVQGFKLEEATFKNPFGEDAENLLKPLLKEFHELKHLVEEVKQYQQTQKVSSQDLAEKLASLPPHCLPTDTPFIEAWDAEACNQVTVTLGQAANLAGNVTNWVFNAGLTIGKEVYKLIHCWQQKPDVALKCVVNDITEIKNTIDTYKPLVKNFKRSLVSLAAELRKEFRKCLSIQHKTHAIAEQVVVQAQLCDNVNLH